MTPRTRSSPPMMNVTSARASKSGPPIARPAIDTTISPEPIARLVSGPASATAISARADVARVSTAVGDPTKWTEIASTGVPVRRETRAWASSWITTLNRNPSDATAPTTQAATGSKPGSTTLSRPPTVTVMIATMKIHERWIRISIPNRRATGTPLIRSPPARRPASRRGGSPLREHVDRQRSRPRASGQGRPHRRPSSSRTRRRPGRAGRADPWRD